MNRDENCCKEESDLFRLHTDVACEARGCCRITNIHYTLYINLVRTAQ
jgi:hypothetical protein